MKFTASVILSLIAVLLSIIVSAGGLLIQGLYRDNHIITTAWMGSDLITLILVAPVLLYCLTTKEKSIKVYFTTLGLLAYLIYNYAFYLFGAAFNSFFLLYVAIFSLSLYAFILTITGLDIPSVPLYFPNGAPKWLTVFLLFISVPLALAEISMCLNFLFTQKVPEAPSLIFALDLTLVVPNTALAAIFLWQKKAWGYVLTAIMLVKAMTYGLSLCISTALIGFQGKWDPLTPFYVFITAGGIIAFWTFLFSIKEGKVVRSKA